MCRGEERKTSEVEMVKRISMRWGGEEKKAGEIIRFMEVIQVSRPRFESTT